MRIFGGRVGVGLEANQFGRSAQVGAGIVESVWVGQDDVGAFFQQGPADCQGG